MQTIQNFIKFSIKLVMLYSFNFHSALIHNVSCIHHWNGSVATVWRENMSSLVAKLSSKTDSFYHYDYSNLQGQSSFEYGIDIFLNINEHLLIPDYNSNSLPVIHTSKLQEKTLCIVLTYLFLYTFYIRL